MDCLVKVHGNELPMMAEFLGLICEEDRVDAIVRLRDSGMYVQKFHLSRVTLCDPGDIS